MNKDGRIPHDVHTKYASSEVMIMPAPGRGLVAGSSVRTVLELGWSERRYCEDLLSQ